MPESIYVVINVRNFGDMMFQTFGVGKPMHIKDF